MIRMEKDVDLTEKLDYFSAIALLGYSLIVGILRSFNVRQEAARVMVSAPLLAFVTTHILYLNNYKMDYVTIPLSALAGSWNKFLGIKGLRDTPVMGSFALSLNTLFTLPQLPFMEVLFFLIILMKQLGGDWRLLSEDLFNYCNRKFTLKTILML